MDFIKVRHLVTFIHLSPLILYNVQKIVHPTLIVGSKQNINTKKNGKQMSLLIFWLQLLNISKSNIFKNVTTRSSQQFQLRLLFPNEKKMENKLDESGRNASFCVAKKENSCSQHTSVPDLSFWAFRIRIG
jgi:hypothetical protein